MKLVITARSTALGMLFGTGIGILFTVFIFGAILDIYFPITGWGDLVFSPAFIFLFPVLVVASNLLGGLWLNSVLAGRQKKLAEYASERGFRFDPESQHVAHTDVGSLTQMQNAVDTKISNIVSGDDWKFCDFSYQVNDRKHKDTIYYGVMVAKLSRKLPHILFDSLKSRQRQFRFEFKRSQRQSLEGDFDQHFVTYIPRGYQIDSLSFISPEVMLALRDASNYDIEIIDDRLFMYGPLFNPAEQLDDMAAHIKRIKRELNDNIDTYLDTRVPYEVGRQVVSATGGALRRSNFMAIVSIIAFALWMLFWFFIGSQD